MCSICTNTDERQTSATFTRTLRVTPAMEAGLPAHMWSGEERIAVLDADAARQAASIGRIARASSRRLTREGETPLNLGA